MFCGGETSCLFGYPVPEKLIYPGNSAPVPFSAIIDFPRGKVKGSPGGTNNYIFLYPGN